MLDLESTENTSLECIMVSLIKSIKLKIDKILDRSGSTSNSKKTVVKGNGNTVDQRIIHMIIVAKDKFLEDLDDMVNKEEIKNNKKSSKLQKAKVKFSEDHDVKNAFDKAAKVYQEKITECYSKSLQLAYEKGQSVKSIPGNQAILIKEIKSLEDKIKDKQPFENFEFFVGYVDYNSRKQINGEDVYEVEVLLWDNDAGQLFFVERQYPLTDNENEIKYDDWGEVQFLENAKYHVVSKELLTKSSFKIQQYLSDYLGKFYIKFCEEYKIHDQMKQGTDTDAFDDDIPY